MRDQMLVTTDGSDLHNLALPVTTDLARKYDSSLTLLYVALQPLMVLKGTASPHDSTPPGISPASFIKLGRDTR